MRVHRFYVPGLTWNKKIARVSDASVWNQMRNVFRYTVGAQVLLFDGTGIEYLAMIARMERGELTFSLMQEQEGKRDPDRIVELAFALTKKPALEEMLLHATEIGVSIFTPFAADRSVTKSFHRERAQKIIIEASEQSGRALLPTIGNVLSLEAVCARETVFAFDPSGHAWGVNHIHTQSRVTLVIGPEGGWSDRELQFLRSGPGLYSLSSTVLRAETAALAAVSVVLIG